jgi:hypothetical protein
LGVAGFGVEGSGVVGGRTGLGLGRGVAPGAGGAGMVFISSRALRKARFFASSEGSAASAGLRAIQSAIDNSTKRKRTRRML